MRKYRVIEGSSGLSLHHKPGKHCRLIILLGFGVFEHTHLEVCFVGPHEDKGGAKERKPCAVL